MFHSNDLALVIVYSFLSFMGLLFSITCLIFNIMFKNHRYSVYCSMYTSNCPSLIRLVKLTSPKLNVLIIFGTISLYSAVFFYSFTPSHELGATVFCILSLIDALIIHYSYYCFPSWEIIFSHLDTPCALPSCYQKLGGFTTFSLTPLKRKRYYYQ